MICYNNVYMQFFRVNLSSDGMCIWKAGGQFISKYPVYVTYCPFDKQVRELVLGSCVLTGVYRQSELFPPGYLLYIYSGNYINRSSFDLLR